jgi:inner membrane protein
MDPLTQGILGATASQAAFGRRLGGRAWFIGLLAGLSADLDVLILPDSDPLGGLSYHRHFTHALVFIPIGGIVATLPFMFLSWFTGKRWWVFAAALLAYATHGLLDACTAYGTSLYWPFSNERIAWNLIGIVDPVFSAVLLIGVAVAAWRKQRAPAVVGLCLAATYMSLGFAQHQRAARAQSQLLTLRNQSADRSSVMPTPGNLIVWRSVYESQGRVHADAIRVSPLGQVTVLVGTSAPLVTLDTLKAAGFDSPEVRHGFERFHWFAMGYTAFDTKYAGVIADVRYCFDPTVISSIWGLRLPNPGSHNPGLNEPELIASNRVEMIALPGNRRPRLWDAILGRDERFQPLAELTHAIRQSS